MSTRRRGPTPKKTVTTTTPVRRSKRRVVLSVLASLVGIMILGVAVVGVRLWTGVTRVSLTPPGAGTGAVNYLLVGNDSRNAIPSSAPAQAFGDTIEVPGERADLVMVLHVPVSGAPRLLTIPRDLLVAFPGLPGTHRLTLAFTKGPQNLVDTLCGSLGIGIDHVAVVNFDGFRSLIDLVGGIDVDFAAPTRDRMTGLVVLEAGRRHLDGTEALALVRSRHAEELTGDEWRASGDGANQRVHRAAEVMRAIAAPVAQMASSTWGKVRLASALHGNVTVDDAMGRDDVDRVLGALRTVQAGPPESMADLPVTLVDGEIPTATLAAGAHDTLTSIGAGTSPGCARVPDSP